MRLAKTLCSSSILVLALACGNDDGNTTPDASTEGDAAANIDASNAATFDFNLDLMGYGQAHNGDTIFFALWDDADDSAAVAEVTLDVMGGGGGGGGGGGNAIEFADGLVEGHAYTLYWFADLGGADGDDTCVMAEDHHWSLAIPAVTGAVSESHRHNIDFDGDCTKH